MERDYVEADEAGFYYVTDTRVALDSVVYAFRRGESPEEIRQSFPALSLEEVYGTITFCLAHPAEVDQYLARQDQRYEAARSASPPLPQDLQIRLRAAARQILNAPARPLNS